MASKLSFLAALLLCAAPLINAANVTISVKDYFFDPNNAIINVGDTVTWTFVGAAAHTVTQGTGCTALAGGFNSGTAKPTGTFAWTFNTTGTINYYCGPHCLSAGMVATLTVVAPNSTVTNTTTPPPTTTTTAATATTTTTTTTHAPVNHTVSVGGINNQLLFSPSVLTITQGDTVVFHLTSGTHNVLSTSAVGSCNATGIPLSSPMVLSTDYSVTFNTVGVYPYMCSFHCAAGMYAQINVVAPGSIVSNSAFKAAQSIVSEIITVAVAIAVALMQRT